MVKPLRSGYTTGACAAAAAKAAALLLRDGAAPDAVTLTLPTGACAAFTLHTAHRAAAAATCSVIKDAGDDPDITNGAEVTATVSTADGGDGIVIEGGAGVGRVTKPGLAVPPGEWAINPVPRRMIEQAVREVVPNGPCRVVVSIPDGEERAKKTLNARLGIIGGLSILGTTGIVRPLSARAWTDTIDAALDVARACGCPTVVLCTGRTSELAAMTYFAANPPPALPCQGGSPAVSRMRGSDLPPGKGGMRGVPLSEEAFIMMGDHVAHALRSCADRGFPQPVLACQFGKLLKIACGHPNTHAAASEMDLSRLHRWAARAKLPATLLALIGNANTAREIITASGNDPALLDLVCGRAAEAVAAHAPSLVPRLLVCGYDGSAIPTKPPITPEK